MLEEFTSLWPKIEKELENKFKVTRQVEYCTYMDLLKVLLDIVNNLNKDFYNKFSTEDIQKIDFGDYQGTLIFVFHKNCYQPTLDETYYTTVQYGSCSVCDTLMSISNYEDGIPNDQQINGYITLCLHLLQQIKKF